MEAEGFKPRIQNDPMFGNRAHAMVCSGQEMQDAGLTIEEIRAKYKDLTKVTFNYTIIGFDTFLVS